MAHLKLVSPSGWDWDRPVAVPLKLSSRGLVGNDRREFLKTASHVFVAEVDRLRDELRKHAGDYEPVHLIALGADERYSGNRNGDAFDESTCRARHGTFVKHARWYRNHKNKPGSTSYGVVKCSAYNEGMKRIELLPFLYKTAAAAERHGGVVADAELEKLARGDDLDVSMACRVPEDECSYCHNRARTREEYCTAEKCAAGGCADNLSKVVKVGGDLHHVRVFNPGADFFDISMVHRRADRIAQAAGADYLTKAAADGGFMGVGSEKAAAALGLSAPSCVLDDAEDAAVAARVKLAYGLAALEASGSRDPGAGGYRLGFDDGVRRSLCARGLSPVPAEKLASHLAALADLGCVLPVEGYAALTKRAELAPAARPLLADVFLRAVRGGTVEKLAARRGFEWDAAVGGREREWASGLEAAYSLSREAVGERAVLASLRGTTPGATKSASAGPGAEALADEYAAYQLAALGRIAAQGRDLALTAFFSVHQNRG